MLEPFKRAAAALSRRFKGTASGTAASSGEADPVSLMEELLPLQEQSLGHDHPDTNETRDRLADAYHRAGRGDDEVPLLKQLLAYRERVLGHDHHDTNAVHNRLGGTYMSLSRWDEAIPHFEQLLAYREKMFGPEVYSVVGARRVLGVACYRACRYAEAVALFERNLTYVDRGGAETYEDRCNLAAAYEAAGRWDQAIPLYEELLTYREQLVGHNDPFAQRARDDLVRVYRSADRPDEAAALSEAGPHRRPSSTQE
ncbi:tetratricopeptide repeat protein [Nocardia vinacea]|uniref:Tetratricopeptide repeat protein n=1 Tax=Nocardia vinacea TaxID=96468 RepID=A0ABZ1YJG6_9NOCA|nr:tetratricopeptide repeat protein [Nocardia vinacea]